MNGSQDSFREKTNTFIDELSKLGDVDYDEIKNVYNLEEWERVDKHLKELLETLLEKFSTLGQQISEATDLKKQIDDRLNAEPYLKMGAMNQLSVDLFLKVNSLIDTLTILYGETIQLLIHSSQYHANAKELIRNPPIIKTTPEGKQLRTTKPADACCNYEDEDVRMSGLLKTKIFLESVLKTCEPKNLRGYIDLRNTFKALQEFLKTNLCAEHQQEIWHSFKQEGLPGANSELWVDYAKAKRNIKPMQELLSKINNLLDHSFEQHPLKKQHSSITENPSVYNNTESGGNE